MEAAAAQERRLLEAYNRVLDVPAPERDAFIRATFASDPALAREVERLAAAGMRVGILGESIEAGMQAIVSDLEQERELAAPRLPGDRASAWTVRYEQLRRIGRGGMGRTLLARDRSTGEMVCIKELFRHLDRQMLKQEYVALSRASHPNVVRVLDINADAKPPYLVSTYIEGATLTAHARSLGDSWRTETNVARLMRPVFDAIAYLHSKEIMHRDLKPENVLVATHHAEAQPTVIDLGLAIVDNYDWDGNVTAAMQIIGTPAYMAPEQVRGEVLTPACDVYALGLLLFELAAGKAAFGGTLRDIFSAKATRTVSLPDGFWRKRWPRLATLIRECTLPVREDRPSAAQARAVLDGMLERDWVNK